MGNDIKIVSKEKSPNSTNDNKGTKETEKKNDKKHDNKSKHQAKKK